MRQRSRRFAGGMRVRRKSKRLDSLDEQMRTPLGRQDSGFADWPEADRARAWHVIEQRVIFNVQFELEIKS
jgi:hypothetical protein